MDDDLHVDPSVVVTAANGARAHRDLVEHGRRFEQRLHAVRPGVWCHVGGGIANISFLEGPDGLVMVDSGESVEEAQLAIDAVREHTSARIVAVIYSHFHYVGGTQAALDDSPDHPVTVVGHERIVANRVGFGAEVGPMAMRGAVSQMGIFLPATGPDAMPNVGYGPFWHNPGLATTTDGFIAPTLTITTATEVELAGLRFVITPQESDSDDSVVLWVPELGTCVNNHVWPALYNVYPLRGEPYRDPVERLATFDLILGYDADHLVGVHGPPVSGADEVRQVVIDYRDSVQFLWDQTIRRMNHGVSVDDLVELVRLPGRFERTFRTQQFYGMAEHHVRQIHNGVRGWFDGDATRLFPVPRRVEATRLVDRLGGRDTVLADVHASLDEGDARWAVQLAGYLLALDPGDPDARRSAAAGLRAIAQTTTGTNARGYCLTQALELEGHLSLDGLRVPVTSRARVLAAPPATYVHALRVQVVPERAAGRFQCVEWNFGYQQRASLRLRDGVAVPGGAVDDADIVMYLGLDSWADLYSGVRTLDEAVAGGDLELGGTIDELTDFFACFEHPHLGRPASADPAREDTT